VSEFKTRLTKILGHAHTVYLGLLPALATFSLLYLYGHPAPLLLFIGGTAAVAVYLAVVSSYTPMPTSLGWALLVLLDGPLWALLSLLSKKITPFAFAIEGFLVDGTAIWIAILILALRSQLPTKEQRVASVLFMLAALGATASLVWPYCREAFSEQWLSAGLLVAGVIESTIVRFKVLKEDKVLRGADATTTYLIVLLLAWVASMILGNVLHQVKFK
jgi:hypothetical protein